MSLAFVVAVAVSGGVTAQPVPTISERDAARAQRDVLRERIELIERQLAEAEQSRAAAADALKQSEQAISEATRKLAEIEARRTTAVGELAKLEQEVAALSEDLAQRQRDLAALLRQQYATGGASPWSALLSGDDPQETGRTLRYLGYVSQARAAAVREVRTELARFETLKQKAARQRAELDELVREQRVQREERVRQQAERERVLAQIADKLAAQRKEASRLTSDEARLTALVTEINRALEQQAAARKRAEEDARRAREREQARLRAEQAAAVARAEQAARDAAASDRGLRPDEMVDPAVRSSLQRRSGAPSSSEAAAGSAPASSLARSPAVPAPSAPAPAHSRALPDASVRGDFAALRGSMRLPARGEIIGRFGGERPGGGTWRGVFIRAPESTSVHAVAPGTVVFSGWLRGFGNLLILDHGGDYLTVYGNNEAILMHVGDTVSAGEVVASAGSSGGQAESGIYFELRHHGKPVDPLQWANLR